jgi:very-short-patch-repair endonuclease
MSARKNKSYTTEEFVTKASEVNKDMSGNSYNYSKTEYVNRTTAVVVTCSLHGDFQVSPANHLNNFTGCPTCGKIKSHAKFLKPVDQMIAEIGLILDPAKYTLVDASEYTGNKSYITMNCKDHGNWLTKPNWILSGERGCMACSGNGTSKAEQELFSYVKSLGFDDAISGDRKILNGLELDVVVESKKIAIEYNGLYYHSEKSGKDSEYHLHKTTLAKRKGYRLLHVYEDEWVNNQELTKKKLAHILGVDPSKRLFARKLFLDRVSYNEAKAFFEENHIQGTPPNHKICYGLFEDGILVAAMSFGVIRFNLEDKPEDALELYRYATSCNIIGGFSRLVSAFRRENPEIKTLYSFSDKRWSAGEVYIKSGFKYVNSSKPSYDYTNSSGSRFNRQNFMKQRMPGLVDRGVFKTFDIEKTEVENCKDNGFYRIWNCGMDKWSLDLS